VRIQVLITVQVRRVAVKRREGTKVVVIAMRRRHLAVRRRDGKNGIRILICDGLGGINGKQRCVICVIGFVKGSQLHRSLWSGLRM
jgi:hypothetical protein